MGRKKPTRFDWVRDRDEPDTPRVERRSRREKTEPLDRAMDLIEQIRNQPAASWPNLPLSEEALQMLRHLVQIKPKARGAIRRQRMLLARALAEEDLDAIAEAVGADGGTSDRDEALELLVRWRSRLIEEGDSALQAFLIEFPDGDRQRLRALATQARKASDEKRARVAKQLMAVLRDAAGIG